MLPFPIEEMNVELWQWCCVGRFLGCVFCLVVVAFFSNEEHSCIGSSSGF